MDYPKIKDRFYCKHGYPYKKRKKCENKGNCRECRHKTCETRDSCYMCVHSVFGIPSLIHVCWKCVRNYYGREDAILDCPFLDRCYSMAVYEGWKNEKANQE